MNPKLLIATNNQGKVAELRGLITGLPFELLSLNDFLHVGEIEETGSTFAANAMLKASGYAKQTSNLALADDSGLEVDALDGRPGVLSARYGGEDMPFEAKMSLLLDEIEKKGNISRKARFICSIAIADPNGVILFSAEGSCEGKIAPSPRGSGGFGYDPLFIPDGFNQTFGELELSIKQSISHRSRAFQQIIPFLRDFNAL
ncbi:MAG: RdgB/HAM1 family non-canonical purine NTP pyrophosphatase [Pyrinomonadaceae bacterium]